MKFPCQRKFLKKMINFEAIVNLKIQGFEKKTTKKSKHCTKFFDQSGELKIRGHFLR